MTNPDSQEVKMPGVPASLLFNHGALPVSVEVSMEPKQPHTRQPGNANVSREQSRRELLGLAVGRMIETLGYDQIAAWLSDGDTNLDTRSFTPWTQVLEEDALLSLPGGFTDQTGLQCFAFAYGNNGRWVFGRQTESGGFDSIPLHGNQKPIDMWTDEDHDAYRSLIGGLFRYYHVSRNNGSKVQSTGTARVSHYASARDDTVDVDTRGLL